MKFFSIHLIILMCHEIQSVRYQRLVLPTTASEFKIIPRLEMPMSSTNSIATGFNCKMPMTIQFPSAMDFVNSVRQSLTANQADSPSTETLKLNSNKTRVNSRSMLYKAIEKSHSFGAVCLKRAICEVSEVPFISASHGLLGEIVDMLLTSSVLSDSTGLLKTYREVEKIGRKGMKKGDKCKTHFKECPISLFNVIDFPFFG